ncbi:MAG: single-stranded DNA-binding protein [Carbonactinosporaceae bacterium]
MSETLVTVIGNVAQDVRHVQTKQGVHIASFRIASGTRRYDRVVGRWVDGETNFLTVTCWRVLAEHVASCVAKGDPVVVSGRLRIRQWARDDGTRGTTVEIDAHAVGHDLARGTSAFKRMPQRTEIAREVADEMIASLERESETSDDDREGDGQRHGSGDTGSAAPQEVAA